MKTSGAKLQGLRNAHAFYVSQLPKDNGCVYTLVTPLSDRESGFCYGEVSGKLLFNRENGNVIAMKLREADTFWKRLRGLMFEPELPIGTALHIVPCRSIHTFFMRFPIDVLYLDRNRKVVAAEERILPRRMGKLVRDADSVLELPAGSIRATSTEVGQTVCFIR